MDKLLNTDQNLLSVLMGIVLMMSLNFLLNLGKVAWDFIRKKNEVSESNVKDLIKSMDSNTRAVEKLEHKMVGVERNLSELPKLKEDLRRLFSAIKVVAGEDWPDIRKEIMEDGLTSP